METQEITLTGGRRGGRIILTTEAVDPWNIGEIKGYLDIDEEGVHRTCFYRRDAATYAVFIEEVLVEN
jgi:hypothetical protein